MPRRPPPPTYRRRGLSRATVSVQRVETSQPFDHSAALVEQGLATGTEPAAGPFLPSLAGDDPRMLPGRQWAMPGK